MISPQGRGNLPYVLAGALTGLLIGCAALDPGFIAGTGGKWIRPDDDLVSYTVALRYFVADVWRFPLFDLPAMSYPEGTNLALNDSLPLAALLTKLLFHLTGVRINPFGPWMFLAYVLQGAMAARLVCALGVRSVWASVTAAVLAIANTFFLIRFVHTALSGQFLILWGFALYFESLGRGRARSWEFVALLAIALLVNPYLFVMAVVLETVTLARLGFRRQVPVRDAGILIGGGLAVAALGLASGYGTGLTRSNSMVAIGYGFFSWNLVSTLLPPDGFFGALPGVRRDFTGGQYEGDSYLGLGALLLLMAFIVSRPRTAFEALRRHWLLVLALSALALFAASNRIFFGSTQLAFFPLPPRALHVASMFRASGRFVWPLAYCLALLPLAGIFRHWRPRPAAAVASLALCLQVYDAIPLIQGVRAHTSQPAPDLIEEPRLGGWIGQHTRVWQYPSTACGGLESLWVEGARNRELQLQLAAASAGVPINSARVSRTLKDCRGEERWAAAPRLEDGVLYVLSYDALKTSPALDQIGNSTACERLQWWLVCSAKWDTKSTKN
jgi:hypothetical protein